MLGEDRRREPEPAVHVERGGSELDLAVLIEELDGDVAGLPGHAVELVDEVHVPRRAAKLAVGRRRQTDLLLLGHHLADRVVLDRPQRVRVDAPGREIVPRCEQPGGAEQAARVVGAERRPRASPRPRRGRGLVLHAHSLTVADGGERLQ
jgi:hypothetical protein